MKIRMKSVVLAAGAAAVLSVILPAQGPAPAPAPGAAANPTKIVFLGTGVAVADPARQGMSLAIIVNGKPYLVDVGSSLVRQAAAVYNLGAGVADLRVDALQIAFLTHLHSDHTLGMADLVLIPWLSGRKLPLQLYGPTGVKNLGEGTLAAYKEDIRVRSNALDKNGIKLEAHEIHPGPIYEDQNVQVKAFAVRHGAGWDAFGYRFDAGGKSIVVSGDTGPVDAVAEACNGCDVLIHESETGEGPIFDPGQPVKHMVGNPNGPAGHTSSVELGKIAAKAHPKTLIVTHWIRHGDGSQDDMMREIRQNYSGPMMVARDLDIFVP